MYIRLHVRCRYSCQVLIKLDFPNMFSKNTEISNFMKIRPVGTELFHVDGQMGGRKDERTDLSKLIVTFGDFVKVRKLHLSALSSLRTVGTSLQFKNRTDRLKIKKHSLAANMTESNNVNPFKTNTANNLIEFFVQCSLIYERASLYVKVGRPRLFIFLISVLLIQHEYGTSVE